MGKRNSNGTAFYQCDYTALPMLNSNCWMPTVKDGKVTGKHGSYCNWESVVAHADMQLGKNQMSQDDYNIIVANINSIVGANVNAAPKASSLAWFGGDLTADNYHALCCGDKSARTAVKITFNGTVEEIQYSSGCGFEDYMTRPRQYAQEPQQVDGVGKRISKDKDVVAVYYPFKNSLPLNQTASNLLKVQIYGDVILASVSKEPCFMERRRFINYTHDMFVAQFQSKKRKEPTVMSPEAFAQLKAEMQSELTAVEASASARAEQPGELAKAAVMPPPLASELLALVDPTGHKRQCLEKRLTEESQPSLVEAA